MPDVNLVKLNIGIDGAANVHNQFGLINEAAKNKSAARTLAASGRMAKGMDEINKPVAVWLHL